MKTQMDRLLRASLAPLADYNEKQLLKAGQLGKCASQILQRRRKMNLRYTWFFMFTICTPIVLQLIGLIFSRSNGPEDSVFIMFSFISFSQIPTLLELRLSQTRLETLIGMWLLTDHDDSKLESDDDASALADVVFGNA